MTGIVNLVFWTSRQAAQLGKAISPMMVKRVLRSGRFSWRRVRRSMKNQRDEGLFEFFKSEIQHLRTQAGLGHFRLWFYDESGFNLNPSSVYAWLPPQKQAKPLCLPAQRGNVLTIAGFLGLDNTLEAYAHQGPMDSWAFIAFVEDFIKTHLAASTLKHIVIIDNASFHKSVMVKEAMEGWKKQNLFFQFIPPYCSELNRIEILWRRAKHNWLELADFASAERLEKAVLNIFKFYGTKYSITFD